MARTRRSAKQAGAATERAVADYLAGALDERWLPIPGWEGQYEVSDQGSVRSLDRTAIRNGRQIQLAGRNLKPGVYRSKGHKTGKCVVTLCRDGKPRTCLVHRLVLRAFVGPPAPGEEARHWNDDGSDNRLSNLSWGTRSENLHDAVRNGRHWQANKTHCKHGHEFTSANTFQNANGNRQCRSCGRASNRRRRAAQKAAV